jgi:hypothetical protein
VGTTHCFNVAAIAKGAPVIQVGLFNDIAHVVHEKGTTIPTGLDIASRTNVVVGASNTRASRRLTLCNVGRYFIAAILQQRE